jgi:hypothetical protein
MNYVSAVFGESVRIVHTATLSPEVQALAAHTDKGETHLSFASKAELAEVLAALQRSEFFFADELAGWPPAAMFQQLREESLVNGVVRTVSWKDPNKPVFGEV